MRRWQAWFFQPTVQLLLWVVGLGLLGFMLVTSSADRGTRVQVERPATSRSVGGREGRPFFRIPSGSAGTAPSRVRGASTAWDRASSSRPTATSSPITTSWRARRT